MLDAFFGCVLPTRPRSVPATTCEPTFRRLSVAFLVFRPSAGAKRSLYVEAPFCCASCEFITCSSPPELLAFGRSGWAKTRGRTATAGAAAVGAAGLAAGRFTAWVFFAAGESGRGARWLPAVAGELGAG